MAEDPKPTEMVPNPGETPPAPVTETAAAPLSTEQLQAELDATKAALKKANTSDAKRRKQIEALDAAETARAEAELTEMEKVQKQLAEATAALQTHDLNALKRKVATAVGIPESLALRLQGSDEDSLTADAETLLKSLPKKTAPTIPVTNPGANGQPIQETPAQRLARIRGGGIDPFNPIIAAKHGGGAMDLTNKNE